MNLANYMISSQSEGSFTLMLEGVRRKNLVHGDKTILCKFELDKGAELPLHSHPFEQTGYLLAGKMLFSIDGNEHEMKAGDSWCIKADVKHGVKVLEDVSLIELFSPVRDDFLK